MKIEGEIEVVFEEGVATFTHLRVDRASPNLKLSFITDPGIFTATSLSFNVNEPPADTLRREIVLLFSGNISILLQLDKHTVVSDIRASFSDVLDIDISRIQNVQYQIQVLIAIIIHH